MDADRPRRGLRRRFVRSIALLATMVALTLAFRCPAAPAESFDAKDVATGTWTGAVSAAMEAMRVVCGPMTPEETATFEAGWAPMFREPYPEAVEWLERLTPLVVRFLGLRAGMARAAYAFDEAWAEAMTAAAVRDESSVREALSVAWAEKWELDALSADVAAVVKEIEGLGDPPNPVAIGRRLRKEHERAVRETKKAGPAAPPVPVAEGNAAYVLVRRWTETAPPLAGERRTVSWSSGGAKVTETWPGLEKVGLIQNGVFEYSWTEPPSRFKPAVFARDRPVGKDRLQQGEAVTLAFAVKDAGSRVFVDPAKNKDGRAMVVGGAMIQVKDGLQTRGREMIQAKRSTEEGGDVPEAKGSLALRADVSVPVKPHQERIEVVIAVNGASAHWEYAFDATGTSVEPLAGEEGGGIEARDEKALLADRIAEHRDLIEAIRRNMEGDRKELAGATGARREDLLRRLLYADADIHAEEDFIASLETGKAVHTRTALDQVFHARFVQQVQAEVMEFADRDRLRAGVLRLAARATIPGEDHALREFVFRNTDARSDAAHLRKIAGIVANKVMGPLEGEVAKSDADLAWHDYKVKVVTDLKATTDRQMFLLALTAGPGAHSVMIAYQAATGFVEGARPSEDPDAPKDPTLGGRVLEAVRRGAAWYNTATFVATEAFEGYSKGGYFGGETNKGTIWGAVERAGEAFLLAKAIEYGVGRIFGGKPGDIRDLKKLTLRERIDILKYKQEVEHAASLVDDYGRSFREYRNALSHGASGAEAAALEKALRGKAAAIHATPEAKMILKQSGAAGKDLAAIEDFVFRMEQNHKAVQKEFLGGMKARHYDNPEGWPIREFRNSASAGSVPMDYDVGMVEKGLTFTKNGLRVSVPALNEEAQHAWNEAYRKVTGYSPGRSFETFTTSVNKEAYRDLAWLGDETVKHVKVNEITSGWAGQAADVTAVKAQDMLAGQGGLTRLQGMAEAGRGMAKDVETKLIPVLESAMKKSPSEAKRIGALIDRWRGAGQVLGTAPKNPLMADRLLRLKTGGKGITETANDLRDAIAAFGEAAAK